MIDRISREVSKTMVNYNPSKHIPQAIKELKTFSPTEISQYIQEHFTEKDRKTKKRKQVIRTPESISMWMKRNPQTVEKLQEYTVQEAIESKGVSERDFENGTFEKIPCIDEMAILMRGRKAKEASIKRNINFIKRICLGQLPQTKEQMQKGEPIKHIDAWGLKHPRRLTLDDCLKFNSEMVKAQVGSRDWRLAMRCFLQSRGIKGWGKLSGAYEGAGKYAHLYAPKPKLNEIFAWLQRMSTEAHDATYFGFKTGARIGGTLKAEAKYVDVERRVITIFEKAHRGKGKTRVKKKISPDLWRILEPRIKRGGLLFRITAQELNGLLRACYREVIPELEKDIPMPFHFMRHQFAQHGLRATGWNTSLIAKLGGWTPSVLERYYGKMDEQTAFNEASKFLEAI